MKNRFFIAAMFIFLLFFFKQNCAALENIENNNKFLNEQLNELNINDLENSLPDDVKKDLNDIGVDLNNPQDMNNFNIFNIFNFILKKATKIINSPVKIFINCIVVIILCALFNSFKTTTCITNLNNATSILMALCTCAILITPTVNVISSVSHTIKNFSNFMLCFIPVFASVIAMSKGVVTSLSYNSTIFLIAQVISSITSDFLLPFTSSFLSLSISGSINESFNISGLTNAAKKVIIFILSLLVTIFVGIFTIQTTISSNVDTMSMKTAKFLSSSFIPIIGSSLGDAFASIVGGLNVIKSAIGGFGIIVCLITLIPPILTVGFFIIFTAFAAEMAKALEIQTMPKTLTAIKDCLCILLAFLVCYSILIISTTSIIITMGAR